MRLASRRFSTSMDLDLDLNLTETVDVDENVDVDDDVVVSESELRSLLADLHHTVEDLCLGVVHTFVSA